MDNFNDSHNPVPVILSLLSGIADSDKIIEIIQQSGISIDLTLDSKDDFSHKTRIRAYIPRVERVFRESTTEEALHTLTVTSGTIIQHYPEKEQEIRKRLNAIGWDFSDGNILPASSNVSKLYFTKGLEHTAYIEIRRIISTTENKIIIIDQWIDNSLFELLKVLDKGQQVEVLIITKKNCIDTLAHEAQLFSRQYSTIRLRFYDSNDFHDRFIIVDYLQLYHLGASIKDTGKKVSIISKIETQDIIDDIIGKVKRLIGET
jgi:hypothetical protein